MMSPCPTQTFPPKLNTGFRTLHIVFWLMNAAVLTTQDLLLILSSEVTATCGQQVTLECNVSSTGNLLIKHLSWIQNNETVCEHDKLQEKKEGFRCNYTHGRLTLTFQQSQLQDSKIVPYMCKLRANQGHKKNTTWVELKECCKEATVSKTFNGHTCNFTGIYPGGDVHWFRGDTKLTEDIETRTRVDDGGYLTITSLLKVEDEGSYKCSLWNPESKKYIACVYNQEAQPERGSQISGSGNLGTQWSIWTYSFVAFLLLKLVHVTK